MTDSVKDEIEKIVNKIIKEIPVIKIILFGSYAYGIPNSDSDIDICIISEENKRKIDLIHDIRKTVRGAQYPLDILVYKSDEFENRANSLTSIEHNIAQKGIVLYG